MHIRIAQPQDTDLIAPLFDAYRQFYEQGSDLPLAASFIRDRLERGQAVVLLAQEGEGAPRPLGFCLLYPGFCSLEAAPIYVLNDLFVVPGARRTGAGKALLAAAERHAAAQGVRRMDLTTARTNFKAQALYESMGWLRDEVYFAYNRTVQAAPPQP